jgi:hypothetical protein
MVSSTHEQKITDVIRLLDKELFLPLLKRTPDFAAFAMMDTPAEAVTQFSMVELGQDTAAERRVVDVVKDYVDRLGDPADFGERAGQGGRLVPDLERPHDAGRLEMPDLQRTGEADDIRPVFADQREIDGAFAEAVERAVIGFAVYQRRREPTGVVADCRGIIGGMRRPCSRRWRPGRRFRLGVVGS